MRGVRGVSGGGGRFGSTREQGFANRNVNCCISISPKLSPVITTPSPPPPLLRLGGRSGGGSWWCRTSAVWPQGPRKESERNMLRYTSLPLNRRAVLAAGSCLIAHSIPAAILAGVPMVAPSASGKGSLRKRPITFTGRQAVVRCKLGVGDKGPISHHSLRLRLASHRLEGVHLGAVWSVRARV